jgi:hypothetical protein
MSVMVRRACGIGAPTLDRPGPARRGLQVVEGR